MADVHQSEDVGVDHAAPVLGVGALDPTQQHDAGVVDDHVESAERVDGGVDGSPHGRLVGDVELQGQRVDAVRADLLLEVGEPVDAASGDGHGRTRIREGQCGGVADAGGGAGDECGLAVERARHEGPP